MSDTTVTATPGGHEVRVSREFRASRDRVFEAYTDPGLFVQWMGPSAFTMAIVSCETVAEGTWRYVCTDPAGNDVGFHGVYHDVVKDERIVQTFEFEGAPGHVSFTVIRFEENEGKTTVTSTAILKRLKTVTA
jgi:uncharacterized protein YndB with AHSA1/START domain